MRTLATMGAALMLFGCGDESGSGPRARPRVLASVSGFELSASPASAASGEIITVSWTAADGQTSSRDWIGFYRVGDDNSAFDWSRWTYTDGWASGSFSVTAPGTAGPYEFRYLLDDGYTDAARSNPVTVGSTPPPPPSGSGGDLVFDDTSVNTFRIEIDPADWDALVAEGRDDVHKWKRATVTWESPWGTVVLNDVGIRKRGYFTAWAGNPKPSLRVKFDQFVRGQQLDGLNEVPVDGLMWDYTMMRDRLVYGLFRERGLAAPRCAHVRFYVNGEYRGVYLAEERINKQFVDRRWGSAAGQVYEYEPEQDIADAELKWRGSDPALYVPDPFEPRVDSRPPGAEEIRDLVAAVNFDPGQAGRVFDVDGFLEYMAIEYITGEADGYCATWGWINGDADIYSWNFFVGKRGDQFVMIPWDRNSAYWDSFDSITRGYDEQTLTRTLLVENGAHFEAYKRKLRDLANGAHSEGAMSAKIDQIFAQIRSHAEEDPFKGHSLEEMQSSVNGLKDYVAWRNNAARSQTK